MPRRDMLFFGLFAFCLAVDGLALQLAWASMHPCTDSFEGGCGYGQAAAGVLSWLLACVGCGTGVVLAVLAMEARRRRAIVMAAWAWAIGPGLYVIGAAVALAVALSWP